MSRDTCLKLGIMSITLAVGVVLLRMQGMTFRIADGLAPVAVLGVLGPVAIFYRQRQSDEFVLSLAATMQIMVYFSCFTVLMYAGAALSFPLIDDTLVACDAALGFHAPIWVAWAQRHPVAQQLLVLSYNSVLPQTLLIVLLLGFSKQRRSLESFVLQFMLCLFVVSLIFILAPAEGPFCRYGFEPNLQQARYLEHLHGLRSGARTLVTLKGAEGLVTFPSFHTSWAILLAVAVRQRKWLFPASVILNAAVIVATLTTGWHYLTDVLGGIVLAVVAIWVCRQLEPWLVGRDQERQVSSGG